MLRNREFITSVLIQAAVLVAGLLAIEEKVADPLVITAVMGVLMLFIHIEYTRKRYQEVRRLTEYVTNFQYGRESLDLLDNREGELSILKNTLYKLCMKLLHQQELLKQDKTFLADSISDISHQLKTPLTSITVMADLLDQQDLEETKRKEFIRNIVTSLDRMNWLIQALLKIAKLDAGSIVFKEEPVLVQTILTEAGKAFVLPMELNNLTYQIEGNTDIKLCCDKSWTVEAISNILKNCMEHTKEGGSINVSYGDNNIYTFITIEDTGVGIAKEDLPHIFERFYRGRNQSMNSVGIGLPLARSIIMRQKGTIEVTSTEGVGTKFVIKFYR